jgi:hypothetical protein
MARPGTEKLSRRRFLERGAGTAAATIVARHVLGGPRFVPPSDRIGVAYVGCGTQGIRQLILALPRPDLRIAAVCDPNRLSEDYVEWSRGELRDKVRAFLGEPRWGEGARGCAAGRELARELVDRHYGATAGGCRAYADFRELLAVEKGIDAVYVMTPDHLHATIALAALRAGKHVITHKPVSNVMHEARLVIQAARETGLATQMFCAAGLDSTPLIGEWLAAGAIGPVREVHNWSTRPYWPQGMTSLPSEPVAVPPGFDWDLWLGPVPHRAYHPSYTHAAFRGWYDFGTGALGDMGHYSFFQVFRLLGLGSPRTVEASHSESWRIDDRLWKKQPSALAYPQASMVRWEFPERGSMPPVALHWYDGGLRPPKPRELDEDGEPMPEEGLLFVGDSGKLLADFSGRYPRLIPKSRMARFQPPPRTLPRPAEELEQFVRACRGTQPADASIPNVAAITETILTGTIALRVDKKLRWDAQAWRFVGAPEADALMTRSYRDGWAL